MIASLHHSVARPLRGTRGWLAYEMPPPEIRDRLAMGDRIRIPAAPPPKPPWWKRVLRYQPPFPQPPVIRKPLPAFRAYRRFLPIALTLAVLSLAFGADTPAKYKGVPLWLLRPLFAAQARAATGGTVGPYTYTARTRPYTQVVNGVPSRCVTYWSRRRAVVVCVPRKTAPKA